MGNSCSLGLRHVFMVLVLKCHFSFFPPLGLWSGNIFLIAPFSDHCLLVPFQIYQKSTDYLSDFVFMRYGGSERVGSDRQIQKSRQIARYEFVKRIDNSVPRVNVWHHAALVHCPVVNNNILSATVNYESMPMQYTEIF